MAISRNPLKLTGRFGILTLYKVGDQIRMRVRKPLSRNRVLKSPQFKNTRKYAGWMSRASRIGSRVYQALPKEFRQFWMYRAFVGEAMTMLKKGQLKDEEVFNVLWMTYASVWHSNTPAIETIEPPVIIEAKKSISPSDAKLSVRWNMNYELPVEWNRTGFTIVKLFEQAYGPPEIVIFPGKVLSKSSIA